MKNGKTNGKGRIEIITVNTKCQKEIIRIDGAIGRWNFG